MSNENTEYEILVQNIHQSLLQTQGLETVKVLHDVILEDRVGNKRQFDVYWEYKIAGFTHKVVLECRNYKNPIKPEGVDAFCGKIQRFPGLQGIMVATQGYTSGAIQAAKDGGIGLRIIRPALWEDYEGRVRKIYLRGFFHYINLVESPHIELDSEWISHNLNEDQKKKISEGLIEGREDLLKIRDEKTEEIKSFHDLINELPVHELLKEIDPTQIFFQTLSYENAYLITPSLPELKIISLRFKYSISTYVTETTIGDELARHMIKDAIDGNVLFIEESGLITGDRKAFGIDKSHE